MILAIRCRVAYWRPEPGVALCAQNRTNEFTYNSNLGKLDKGVRPLLAEQILAAANVEKAFSNSHRSGPQEQPAESQQAHRGCQ
jgi:hypothetical protein